jgi:tetratricopeptide (TPR) repeat protein
MFSDSLVSQEIGAPRGLNYGDRVSLFESNTIGDFMKDMVISSSMELALDPTLVLKLPDRENHSVSSSLSEAFPEPQADLVISRIFADNSFSTSFPDPIAISEELFKVFSLAKSYVILVYSRRAPFKLWPLVKNLSSGFSLEGFVPHRFPSFIHDRYPASDGDLYFFTLGKENFPDPYGISGGMSLYSPIKPAIPMEDLKDFAIAESISQLKALTSMGYYAEALPILYNLVVAKPRDLNFRINLGVILALLGEIPEAYRVLKGVLAEDPSHGLARKELAKISLSQRDFEVTRAFLPEIVLLKQVDPKIAKIWPEIREGLLAVTQ